MNLIVTVHTVRLQALCYSNIGLIVLKMHLLLFILLFVVESLVTAAVDRSVSNSCPDGVLQDVRYLQLYGDWCFQFVFNHHKTYYKARDDCVWHGGTLALPKTQALNNFLSQTSVNVYGRGDAIWIGLNKLHKSNFVWEDNTPMTWSNFAKGNGHRNKNKVQRRFEPCVAVRPDKNGEWHDYQCTGNVLAWLSKSRPKKPYICQYPLKFIEEKEDDKGPIYKDQVDNTQEKAKKAQDSDIGLQDQNTDSQDKTQDQQKHVEDNNQQNQDNNQKNQDNNQQNQDNNQQNQDNNQQNQDNNQQNQDNNQQNEENSQQNQDNNQQNEDNNQQNQDNNQQNQDNNQQNEDNNQQNQDNNQQNQDNNQQNQDNNQQNQDNNQQDQDNNQQNQDNNQQNEGNNQQNQDNNQQNEDNNQENQDNNQENQDSNQQNEDNNQENQENNQQYMDLPIEGDNECPKFDCENLDCGMDGYVIENGCQKCQCNTY